MRIVPAALAVATALPFVSTCAAQKAEPKTRRPAPTHYALPRDPKAVVLTLDYTGGSGPPRRGTKPYFEVRADGSMVVRDVSGAPGKAEVTGRMSPEQLQALLHFVVAEQRLTDWNEEAVGRALQGFQSPELRAPRVTETSTSVVKLSLPNHEVTARFAALWITAPRFPRIAELQSLFAVESRLRHRAAVVLVGGEKQAEALRTEANAALADELPKCEPFARTHLLSAINTQTGGIMATFCREHRLAGGERRQVWAMVTCFADGDVEVEVHQSGRPH
ncbi:MAG TPA: hypothetical protein ENI87_08100 [bacterium]|nr:hypothetical protein [bacterium]